MKIQIFKNAKGLIHGADAKRISCDIEGTLKIGTVEIKIPPEQESIMPLLFNGTSGVYSATFTSIIGNVYELENVKIKGGRIVQPSQTSIELMELRSRVETLEETCESLKEKTVELENIFDTNSLNFLIH